MKLVDTHTHSCFSADSRMDMQAAIQQARQNGLYGIIFTEHFDFDVPEGLSAFEFDPTAQQRALQTILQAQEPDPDLVVLAGIEVGMQPQSIAKIENLLQQHDFDQVIASVHFVDGEDPYHGGYYIGKPAKVAYRRYLEMIYECTTRMPDFDCLGHFDYIARYAPYPDSMNYREHADLFDAIFKQMVERGQALELNTKTYRLKPDGNPTPDPAIYRRFKELGGEALSFGSDAHKQESIGFRFDEYREWARSLGFRYSVYYQQRKPVFLPL